ncbi:MAG: hypothetical protein K0S44_2698 [Bacteroidetes bacterium]|jgi:hypothetical protein|nr:hypothetical protein [Bacteroidota bacterium]
MKTVILILFYLLPVSVFCIPDSVAYSRDYEFKEGIFLTAEQFKNNSPVLKSSIISIYPKSQVDFMKQITDQRYITFKAADGAEQKVETMSIWGYAQNRSIFINFNNEFNRINQIGLLSLFTAAVQAPIGYTDPMNTYGINTSDEMRQFIFDVRTNKIVNFDVHNMELILQDDPELYSEFMKLKKRKKADSIFIYLRKYNEKHPLYLKLN